MEELIEDFGEKKFRLEINYVYTRQRRELGRPCTHLKPVGPIRLAERAPDLAERAISHVRLDPVPFKLQTDNPKSDHGQVTDKVPYKTMKVSHTVGGFPKDLQLFDTEAVERYLKRLSMDEHLLQVMPAFAQKVLRCVNQNNSMDIYETYFTPPDWDTAVSQGSLFLRLVSNYNDRFLPPRTRPIQNLCWERIQGVHVAVAHSFLTYQRNDYCCDTECYIWDVNYVNTPYMTIDARLPTVLLSFNRKMHRVILGGLMTGQLCYWDTRCNPTPVAYSGFYDTFRDPPSCIIWINAKSGFECFASSTDGTIVWYDVRNFREPIESIIMDFSEEPSISNAVGVSTLEFEPTIPTKFMVGTEDGHVFVGNRKGKNMAEKLPVKLYYDVSPVKSIERNPSYLKNFLVTGDWAFKIFSEDCKESPIIWCKSQEGKLTAGRWSPCRNSVFIVSRTSGHVDAWDLLQNYANPMISTKVSKKPLRSLSLHNNGRILATAGDSGSLYLLELSNHFIEQEKDERLTFITVLDRETKREKLLDQRYREIRLAQKQKELEARGSQALMVPVEDEVAKEDALKEFGRLLEQYDSKKTKKNVEEDYD